MLVDDDDGVCGDDRNVRRCMEHSRQKTSSEQQQQQTSSGDEQMMIDSDTAAATTDADDEERAAAVVRSVGGESSADGETAGASAAADGGVSVWDDVECKFNVNSCKMIFVVNTKSFLYRRHSLVTARQVSQSVSQSLSATYCCCSCCLFLHDSCLSILFCCSCFDLLSSFFSHLRGRLADRHQTLPHGR